MIRYLAGRLGRIALQVFGVVTLVFWLFRFAGGDPATIILGANATQESVVELRHQMGLDRPLAEQYVRYVAKAFTGDFGQSTSYGEAVTRAILRSLAPTFSLLAVAITSAVVVGVTAGVVAALRPNGWFSRGSLILWVVVLAVPNFWLGMLLVQVFAVQLRVLPAIGYGSPASLVLPATAVAARLVALIARLTRVTVIEVLGEDFIVTARARGLSPARLVLVHALGPASPHVLTMIGLQAGYLLGGAVVIEHLFSYPGMGSLLLAAVSQRDYPLMQGITLFFVAGFLLINLVTDLVGSKIDPRLRTGVAAR
jgi:ABC-type dipeptide/oligopeptide/nickel transport system permease component